ncbi:carboxypeptidase-like regulatory domain-containing protein [Pedobacter sandarakinus]|uniref:carboxypeptidase-like regulatory domain-containing protein n=1 Tax=Pedobacter sandarakinus TaxID=353156 RepID=UPI0022483E08|nr:carboxypeptidase-like regulatory domain-containing protein [Pedobacter sandarakinus]MCX2573930.1 carboxypeptidase-like regulatory domain-containing protein [Pedobacter sandarakinus]
MKHLIIILIFSTILINITFAQTILLKGEVIDNKDNTRLSGVTVAVGNTITKTDKNGFFELNAELKSLKERAIDFSHIGYLNVRLIYQPNHFYIVELSESTNELKEVMIGIGDDILKKAIKRIPENYPDKPIAMKGILRTQTWRNQSEYFKADAIIKAYIPSYNSTERTTIAVLENRIDTLFDRSLMFLRHSSNYNVVDFQDIAHNQRLLNKISKRKNFDYLLTGKQFYNNRKVFVINITQKDSSKVYDKIDATFYIDTASYAFVASNIYLYNLVRVGLIKHKVLNYSVSYDKIGAKWYLNETHTHASSELRREAPETTVDFLRTEIDSIDVAVLKYQDIIQNRDDIFSVDKRTRGDIWAKSESLFQQAEKEGRIERIANTLLDTIKYNNLVSNQNIKKPSFGKRFVNYLSHDNVRQIFGAKKFAVEFSDGHGYKSVTANYGLNTGADFRLYKNVFLGYQISANLWNDKRINLSALNLNLSHAFIFNKSSRNIILSPYFGFEYLGIRKKDERLYRDYFNYGLRMSYELTHRKALFFSSGLNSTLKTSTFNEFFINPSQYVFGFGIVFKR